MAFSERGEKALATCHPDLQRVARLAMTWSEGLVLWDIVQGARTVEQQQQYYDIEPKGSRTKINPADYPDKSKLYAKAKHVTGPGMPYSRAYDIVLVTDQPKGKYDDRGIAFVAAIMMVAAKSLGVKMRWGADWDEDRVLFEPGTLIDGPHFELMT